MNANRQNLDYLAATYSQRMVQVIQSDQVKKPSEADNVYTKALGVLQEHGLYAMALYLLYRSGDKTTEGTKKCSAEELIATQTMAHLWAMLREDTLAELQVKPEQDIQWRHLNSREHKDAILSHFSDTLCAGDLGRMLFIKELFAQTLIYARYHARATPKKGSAQ
jgi:hypothetical protein